MGFNENRNMIFVLFKCDYGRGRKSHRDRITWRQHQKIHFESQNFADFLGIPNVILIHCSISNQFKPN